MPYYTCDMISNKAGFFIDVFWGRNLAIKYEKHVNYKSNQQEKEEKEENEKKEEDNSDSDSESSDSDNDSDEEQNSISILFK